MTLTDLTRDAWLGWRKGGIGASDIAGIIGLSPWSSPWSVWADKCGLLPPEPENEAMSAGRWLEAAIGPWFSHETGLVVAGEQTMVTHPAHPWARCTLDGFVGESQTQIDLLNALGLIEIKVVGLGRRWDEVPAHYQAQGQWQLACTGYERVWFAVLMGRRLDIHEMERDDEDIAYMLKAADDFWHDHVMAGEPPPTDGHDATLRALAAVYPEHDDELAVELDATTVDAWVAAKTAMKHAKADEATHAAAIQARLGEAAVGHVHGIKAVTWRTQNRTTRCKACAFETKSEFRVMRNVKPKEN